MYDAFVAMLAVGMLIVMIKHNKTTGVALYILIIVSMIVGSAPTIQGFLAPLLNGLINAFSSMLGFPSTAGGATYTVGVLAIAFAILAVVLWDKTIKRGELVPLVIACMIVGTTPLITSWLPPAINSVVGAFGFA